MDFQGCFKAIILLAPSAGGKDTVICELARRGIAFPCRRDTSRVQRPGDNGHYRFLSKNEFERRQRQRQYVLNHIFSGHYYGVPVEEIENCWKKGLVAVLKGDIRQIAKAKDTLNLLHPSAEVRTILLLPDPFDFWIKELYGRKLPDVPERIRASKRQLQDCMGNYSHLIDRLVINHYGSLDETIDCLARAISE